MKIKDTLHEIVIAIRQYSYGGFMQIKLANYLVYRHAGDTVLSDNCVAICKIQHACIGERVSMHWSLPAGC